MDTLERRHDEISIQSCHRRKARTLVCCSLDSDGVFKLLNVIDVCRKVGAENGVGGTDAEAGPLNISEGRCGLGWLGPGGVTVGSGQSSS